jgi:hypothetical protein
MIEGLGVLNGQGLLYLLLTPRPETDDAKVGNIKISTWLS